MEITMDGNVINFIVFFMFAMCLFWFSIGILLFFVPIIIFLFLLHVFFAVPIVILGLMFGFCVFFKM